MKTHQLLKRKMADWEFDLRDKLISKIEGLIGSDDGFAGLETSTLRELIFKLTGKDPMEVKI